MDNKWTADDVARIIANPVNAGLGPYPAIVNDEQWLDAMVNLCKERGSRQALRLMLAELRNLDCWDNLR